MSSFSVLLPVLYPVNVPRKKGSEGDGGLIRYRQRVGGVLIDQKRARGGRGMGEEGNGWLMKEETGRVSERPGSGRF